MSKIKFAITDKARVLREKSFTRLDSIPDGLYPIAFAVNSGTIGENRQSLWAGCGFFSILLQEYWKPKSEVKETERKERTATFFTPQINQMLDGDVSSILDADGYILPNVRFEVKNHQLYLAKPYTAKQVEEALKIAATWENAPVVKETAEGEKINLND